MPTIRITDDQHDRIERLRAELSEQQTGPYASVNPEDVLAYLLDLADEVDDPERRVDLDESEPATDEGEGTRPAFPRDHLEQQLDARNRKHAADDAAEMDLYTIAAEYDIAGRSNMTKAELVDAILEEAERLYTDPFHWVDIDFQGADRDVDSPAVEDDPDTQATRGDATDTTPDETDAEADRGDGGGGDGPDKQDDAGGDQLTATLSLLETHDDKWRQADGDARYEVELPDGSIETARTKDDVRAVLFKNY
ncbi:MAG: Rho termination factor N-terminal domain-containing protein [Haloarculaceae archaeon]